MKPDLSGHAVFLGVSESSYRLPYASRRRIADRTELTPVGFGPAALERGPIFDKWSRVLALFGPNFRLLLASGLGHFAAFHMAELRFARLFQFGLRLFQRGFLLTKAVRI